MSIVKLSSIEKRKVSMFMVCLFCAVFAWLFFALSNKNLREYKKVLVFKNLPLNKAFYPLQSDTVMVMVETTGWQELFYGWVNKQKFLEVDLNLLLNKNYMVFSQNLRSFNFKKEFSQKIISIKPDTLFFDFTKRSVKRLPIKFRSDIKYKKQFEQSGRVIINPAYATVIGPEEEIKNLKSWPTMLLKAKKTSNNLTQSVGLAKSSRNNVNVYPSMVDIVLPVEEFTEKQLDIPLKVINNPNYYNVKLYPNKVSIKFMVPLSSYKKVNEDAFQAVVDLNLWQINKSDKLPIKINNKAHFIRVVQVEPHQVDYIVKK
jgi:YbbR domain-containing protein